MSGPSPPWGVGVVEPWKKIMFCYLERCWAILLYLELCWNVLLWGIMYSYTELPWVTLIYLELSWFMGRLTCFIFSYLRWSCLISSLLDLSRVTSCHLDLSRTISNRLESSISIASTLELPWVIWNCYSVVLRVFSIPPVICLENKLCHYFCHMVSFVLFALIT
jgi:hypothetical protein